LLLATTLAPCLTPCLAPWLAACDDAPAVTLSLQVVEAAEVDMDTESIRGFRLDLRAATEDGTPIEESRPFTAQPGQQFALQFPPLTGVAELILFACEANACGPSLRSFAGCTTHELVPAEETQEVFLTLYPALPDGPPPPNCASLAFP
jgi:hypothetical protein